MIRYFHILIGLLLFSTSTTAQSTLTLDSLRAMALRNNKQLAISHTAIEKAHNERREARTAYYPKFNALATYQRTNNEISILNNKQKGALSGMGTALTGNFNAAAQQIVAQHPDLAPLVEAMEVPLGQAGAALDQLGQNIVDAFRTDTRNLGAATIMLTQPLYMGGKLKAYNRITQYTEQMAGIQLTADQQSVLLSVDRAYWQVISLTHKQKLALSYLDMLRHMESDIHKMVAEGVATRAAALSVSVKLNEAEMSLTKVENGLSLSRMLLYQLCGLPMDADVRLYDEQTDELAVDTTDVTPNISEAMAERPELQMLDYAIDIYHEKVKLERSAYHPQLALTGGYLTTYPGLTNGFEKRFRGTWYAGLTLNVPLWNWGETRYKVRAAQADMLMASLRREDARQKVELQVRQSALQVNEANKKLRLSLSHLQKAEENLRTARIGFQEGVINASDVLAAQTAWLQANSDKIDAQIDIRLARAALRHATGVMP